MICDVSGCGAETEVPGNLELGWDRVNRLVLDIETETESFGVYSFYCIKHAQKLREALLAWESSGGATLEG